MPQTLNIEGLTSKKSKYNSIGLRFCIYTIVLNTYFTGNYAHFILCLLNISLKFFCFVCSMCAYVLLCLQVEYTKNWVR